MAPKPPQKQPQAPLVLSQPRDVTPLDWNPKETDIPDPRFRKSEESGKWSLDPERKDVDELSRIDVAVIGKDPVVRLTDTLASWFEKRGLKSEDPHRRFRQEHEAQPFLRPDEGIDPVTGRVRDRASLEREHQEWKQKEDKFLKRKQAEVQARQSAPGT